MQSIKIKDFSCIKSAHLQLTPITLIIGPQASGKSVISKLIYFCTKPLIEYDRYMVEDLLTLDQVKKSITAQFYEWFPHSAWGDKRFVIEFSSGEFILSITRIGKTDRVKISFGDAFSDFYNMSLQKYASLIEKADTENDFEIVWQFRNSAENSLKKWLGPGKVDVQLFIPAGRSFFTSVGKALVAFEHSGILDPITIEFGRRFANLRERQLRRPSGDESALVKALFSEILGGHLRTEGGKEYVQTADGRLIPFSALSSGQQELLPLAVLIRSFLPNKIRSLPTRNLQLRRNLFIEEPEAHLFPRAQNRLVEILAAVSKRRNQQLILTTHSPYVLAKFNNLIKAGQLSRKFKSDSRLSSVIHEDSWIAPKAASAYAIIDNRVQPIIDEEGLIAADYLDEVSGDIADEYSKLLQLEFAE
jgi:energy-coupling factor transporter ATP-binding protein EcfA2